MGTWPNIIDNGGVNLLTLLIFTGDTLDDIMQAQFIKMES